MITSTQKELSKIKNGDMQAISQFINRNINGLRALARRSIKNQDLCSYGLEIDDYINQLYIDLPKCILNLDCLASCIYTQCFYHVQFGGAGTHQRHDMKAIITQPIEIEKDRDNISLLDWFYPSETLEDSYFKSENETISDKIKKFCSKFLTERQSEWLDLYLDGCSHKHICEHLKTTDVTPIKNSAVARLKAFYKDLTVFLEQIHSDYANEFKKRLPVDYEELHAKYFKLLFSSAEIENRRNIAKKCYQKKQASLTSEQRELQRIKKRNYSRLWRERQRQLLNA